MEVTYGDLRRYYAEEMKDIQDYGWCGDRHTNTVKALGCYLYNNPEISAVPDNAAVPANTLNYYRYPGCHSED